MDYTVNKKTMDRQVQRVMARNGGAPTQEQFDRAEALGLAPKFIRKGEYLEIFHPVDKKRYSYPMGKFIEEVLKLAEATEGGR